MTNKIKSKFNKGICECGKKIIHHHYYCDKCWEMLKQSAQLKKNENIKKETRN
jgi:hypothetical protein